MSIARESLTAVVVALAAVLASGPAVAAQNDLGTGIPRFGIYSAATGVQVIVWSLADASIPIPAECSYLTLTPATMGMDSYKVAVAALMLARATNRPVRLYAHAARDAGCGVDYVELG